MNSIGFQALAILVTQGSGLGLGRVGGAHEGTPAGNGVLAAQHDANHRAGRHIVGQTVKKRAFLVHGIKTGRLGLGKAQALESHDFEAGSFHGSQNFPGQIARNCVRLDNGESGLHAYSFSMLMLGG